MELVIPASFTVSKADRPAKRAQAYNLLTITDTVNHTANNQLSEREGCELKDGADDADGSANPQRVFSPEATSVDGCHQTTKQIAKLPNVSTRSCVYSVCAGIAENGSYREATSCDALDRRDFGLGEGLDEIRADENAADDALGFIFL